MASIRIDDLVAITRQMRQLDLNVKMLSSLPYGLLPDYYQRLGKDAEFVYSGTFWEAGLPNPGNQEFVTAYEKEFNRSPAVQSANAYAGCRLFVESVRRAGSLDSDKLRATLVAFRTKTVLGDFAVDERGFQIAHKAVVIQWQDGKQVVVWPDELVSGTDCRPRHGVDGRKFGGHAPPTWARVVPSPRMATAASQSANRPMQPTAESGG